MELPRCPSCGTEYQIGASGPDLSHPFNVYVDFLASCTLKECGKQYPITTLVDLPYYKLHELDALGPLDYLKIKYHPGLENVYTNFARNMERVLSLPFLINWLIWSTTNYGFLCRQAHRDMFGRSEPVEDDVGKLSELHIDISMKMRAKTPFYGTAPEWQFYKRPRFDDLAAWRGTEDVGTAIEAFLGSLITGAWTTFETAATDLWVTTLNLNPALAAKASDAGIRKDKNDPTGAEKDIGKQIRISVLRQHDFNVSNKMGDIMRASKKFSFNSVEGIQAAYRAAFGDKAAEAVGRLSKLAKVRNVLVHSGGIVDQEFFECAKRDQAGYGDWATVPIGAQLPLDGLYARGLVEHTVWSVTELFEIAGAEFS